MREREISQESPPSVPRKEDGQGGDKVLASTWSSPSITSLGKYLLPCAAVSCFRVPRSLWLWGSRFLVPPRGVGIPGFPPHVSPGSGSSGASPASFRSHLLPSFFRVSYPLQRSPPSPPAFPGPSPWEPVLSSLSAPLTSCIPSCRSFHLLLLTFLLPDHFLCPSALSLPGSGPPGTCPHIPLFSSTAQEVLGLQRHPSQGPDEAAGCWWGPQG